MEVNDMSIKNLFKTHSCKHTSKDLVFVQNLYGDQVNYYNARSIWICKKCHKLIYKSTLYDIGKMSDGYHTFNELYHHRAILTAALCHAYKDRCWKSLRHNKDDDPMYKGMFIVGIETPEGTATYHYDIEPYWFLFDVKELTCAPKWDGHTPNDAIKRIQSLMRLK